MFSGQTSIGILTHHLHGVAYIGKNKDFSAFGNDCCPVYTDEAYFLAKIFCLPKRYLEKQL